jgi:hypothetical protein
MLTVPPPKVHAPAPQHLKPNILNMVSALSTPSFNLTNLGAATFWGVGVYSVRLERALSARS